MVDKESKNHVYVHIEYYTGQEEGEDDVGHPYYVAYSDDLHFVTDGETFEELMGNIRECLLLTLHDGDSRAEYGVAPDAQVTLMMELPENYAEQTA
jgi:predicted RNase H-like HicB family nuclease